MSFQRILLFGGHVVDPANDVDQICDVEIVDGKISKVSENLSTLSNDNHDVKFDAGKISKVGENLSTLSNDDYDVKIDAEGCFIVPGLIDIHAHVYQHATVLGVDPDTTCLARGWFSLKIIILTSLI
jgi:dihydroorotase